MRMKLRSNRPKPFRPLQQAPGSPRELPFHSHKGRSASRNLLCLAVLLAVPAIAVHSQHGGSVSTPAVTSMGGSGAQNPLPPPGQGPFGQTDSSMQQKMEHTRLEKLNAERQKQMTDDTAKLLSLATELKAEMDKTNKDTLSIGVVRKAEQIEKLAKSVRERMKAQLQAPDAGIMSR